MNGKSKTVVGLMAGAFILLLAAPAGAQHEPVPGVPITTKSKEALKLLLEGYAKSHNWHAEEAHQLFGQAIAKDPDFALAYCFYGESASDPKVREEGIKKALSLGHLVSKGEQLFFAADHAWFVENDLVKGTELFRQIAEMYPDNKASQLWLAQCLGLGLRDFEKAIPQFEKALALDKDYFPTHNMMAYTYLFMGDYAKAEEHFRIYQRLQPKEANPHDCLGDVCMKTGRFDEAISHYGQAVKLDPTFALSQSKIGSSYILKGQYEEGRRALEKAKTMELTPANKATDEEGIVRSYIYAGDYKRALEAADAAIRLARELKSPGEVAVLQLGKSAIDCELKDFPAAAASIAECRKTLVDPAVPPDVKENTDVGCYFWEVFAAAERKEFARAEAKLDEMKTAIAKFKEPFLARHAEGAAGIILLAKGDYAGADAQLAKAGAAEPLYLHYAAVAKEKAGDAAGARKLYAEVANWNEDTLMYAFVRNKAKAQVEPFRAIATWAYKYTSSAQVDDFVRKAADAGYTHIWCFDGWAGPDGAYTNAENSGGIYVATTDPYLAPLVMGDAGSQLVKAGHARGMKVIAFESIFDMYGCKGKKGIDAGGLTWDVAAPPVLEFYDHFSKACRAAGFDGFLLDEVGYKETKAPALTALFSQTVARSGFAPAEIWVSMRYVSSPCYDLARWKEMGLSFSPWTIYDNDRLKNPNYPLPPELVHIQNPVVVWVYGGYNVAPDIAKSQFQAAKDQGAVGGGYWVANPDGSFTNWDWTGVYARLLRTVC